MDSMLNCVEGNNDKVALFLGGGVPVSNKVSEGGYQHLTETPRRGGTHTKKRNRTKQNILFAQFPAALDAPFARFAPAALRSFRHPGGIPIFDSDSDVGVPKLYCDSEGRGGGVWAMAGGRGFG